MEVTLNGLADWLIQSAQVRISGGVNLLEALIRGFIFLHLDILIELDIT